MRKFMVAATIALALGASATAGTIISPVSAVVNNGGPGVTPIENTINQSGLEANPFVSGVTDFASYIATNPLHSPAFETEWLSETGFTAATVTYNLGSLMTIQALALWNEDNSGIGQLDLYHSTDGIEFTLLEAGLLPTNNPTGEHYLPDVFSFSAGPVSTQFVRFEMSSCPQPGGDGFIECAIGEVAFDAVGGNGGTLPEPASLALVGLGALGMVLLRRRQRR